MASKDIAERPLLFVNSDPSEGGTVAHRRAIYQHVQLKYAKWKRVEKARKLRESATVSSGQRTNPSTDSYSQSSHPASDESQKPSSDPEPAARAEPNIGKPRPGYKYLNGPLTILQRGNSDPFSALPIAVGPKINALMEYSRDYYLPGIQRDVNNPGLRVVGPEWAQCVAFLQDKGLAYSHFARIAALIASDSQQSDVTEDFHTQALIFKSKSMALLRERLAQEPGDPKTYSQILLLMNAELYDRNFAAASAHGAILATLLQNGTIKGDTTFLFKVVYHDAQRASMSMTRPLLDLDHWVPDQIIPIDHLVTPDSPLAVLLGARSLELDPSLNANPQLKQTMADFKQTCLSLLLAMTDKKFADSQAVFYGRFYMSISMGRLVNRYLDAAARTNESSDNLLLQDESAGHARMSAYVSLAALLLLRCLTRIDSVRISGNIILFSANMLIMHRLKETLMVNGRHSRSEIQGKFANARLYALFVGAWLEQARAALQKRASGSSPDSDTDASSSSADLGWFNCEFAEQARSMKLYKWTEVRKILQQFVYADVLEPTGAHWFPRIIQTSKSHVF